MTSLRARLGFWLLLVSTLVGIIAAGISFYSTRSEAWQFFDQQLSIMAHTIDVSGNGPRLAGITAAEVDPEDNPLVQVWDAEGRLVRQWPAGIDLPRPVVNGFQDGTAADGVWRRYAIVSSGFTVQVSQRYEVRDELAREAAYRSLIPSLVTIPLAWLVLGIVIHRIFRRLDDLAAELSRQSASNSGMLPLDGVPGEVRPFVESVNHSLSRMRAVLLAQKRFVADAAHAVRTPIAVLRTRAENLRHVIKDAEGLRRLGDLERGLDRQAQLVRQLLSLARREAGETIREPAPIDLAETVTAVIADLLPLADSRRQDFGMIRSEPLRILADREDLAAVAENLIENAIRHTPEGGTIDVSVWQDGSAAVFEVRDTGPGIPDDELARVIEPFYRASGTLADGSGLGLAIAAAAAERFGGKLTLANRGGRSGLHARLRVPG